VFSEKCSSDNVRHCFHAVEYKQSPDKDKPYVKCVARCYVTSLCLVTAQSPIYTSLQTLSTLGLYTTTSDVKVRSSRYRFKTADRSRELGHYAGTGLAQQSAAEQAKTAAASWLTQRGGSVYIMLYRITSGNIISFLIVFHCVFRCHI